MNSYANWYSDIIKELLSQMERLTHPMADDGDLEDTKELIAKHREQFPDCEFQAPHCAKGQSK
jgi:hypothetical protein